MSRKLNELCFSLELSAEEVHPTRHVTGERMGTRTPGQLLAGRGEEGVFQMVPEEAHFYRQVGVGLLASGTERKYISYACVLNQLLRGTLLHQP